MEIGKKNTEGLFWTPYGGNNAVDIWASCHVYSSAVKDEAADEIKTDSIIVDIGRNEKSKDFANGSFDVVVPALNDHLAIPRSKAPAKGNEAKAIFITHSHTDHINGLYEYVRMGVKLPPIYASEFTIQMIKKGFVENGIDWNLIPEFREVKAGDIIDVGQMKVEAVQASHSIPGSFSYKISNKEACIFHSGDTKADPTSFLEKRNKIEDLKEVCREGVDLMTFDATATNLEGRARYESEICDTYTDLFNKYTSKQIIAPISAGHMERLASVIAAAEQAGKHVIINGGSSMQSHLMGLSSAGIRIEELFPKIKVLSYKNPEVKKLALENTVTITTGIYGNQESPFIKALRKEKALFPMQPDAVIIAPLMGDRYETLQKIMEESPRTGKMTLVTARDYPGLYGSGHAQKDDFKLIAEQVNPKMVIPIHCSKDMADNLNKLASQEGYGVLPRQLHNGETVCVSKTGGIDIIRSKSPEWYGVRHIKDKFGDTKTRFVKLPDHGFSFDNQQDNHFNEKRLEALKKIAEYKNKPSENRVALPLPKIQRNSDGR